MHSLSDARRWVDESARVVVLTGAGISTESGIPDFRGPQGVWTTDPKAEKLSNIHYYMADPEVRKLAWQGRLTHPAWTAVPNAGHRALVELERRGKLHALVTQNIDGLHQRAGTSSDRVIEVHGTVHDVVCMHCGWRGPIKHALDRVQAGEEDPECLECGGMQAATEAEVFIAIGTSLQVYPVAGMVPLASNGGARIVIVNAQPTPFDEIADAVISAPIGEVLPLICDGIAPTPDR
jgi:NAD-dependent deacetylase